MTLYESAAMAQKELGMNLGGIENMEIPEFLTEEQWTDVLERKRMISEGVL